MGPDCNRPPFDRVSYLTAIKNLIWPRPTSPEDPFYPLRMKKVDYCHQPELNQLKENRNEKTSGKSVNSGKAEVKLIVGIPLWHGGTTVDLSVE
jgi:hypothetical protein